MASQTAIIETNNLTKVYKSGRSETLALDKLTLAVQQGEIFGFLGPNGAGKTTTIRLLLDLIRPTEGGARIFGLDINADSVELHKRIGFLPGELNLWKNRSAKQVIHYLATVRGNVDPIKQEAARLAERLQFDMTKKVRDYSSGNKRKLGLILALMHKPDLLILDEPSSGLDPLMQQTFNQMMIEARDEGRTVFLSSHVLSEVQAICDRVGILRDGQLKAVESVDKLTHVEYRSVGITFRDAIPQEWHSRLAGINGVSSVEFNSKSVNIRLTGDFDPVIRAVSDGYIEDISVKEPTLEEIFLAFYGNNREQREKEMA